MLFTPTRVRHSTLLTILVLLSKLNAHGLRANLLSRLSSFLTIRIINVNHHFSKEIAIRSGVPWDPHIGLLFFILFIRDISDIFLYIKSSEKFLSFYKEIMDAQHFPFYIILSNYHDSFCFIKLKITTFDRLGFMFV